jgi:hypothetical protein
MDQHNCNCLIVSLSITITGEAPLPEITVPTFNGKLKLYALQLTVSSKMRRAKPGRGAGDGKAELIPLLWAKKGQKIASSIICHYHDIHIMIIINLLSTYSQA